jgi:hypothetical protein
MQWVNVRVVRMLPPDPPKSGISEREVKKNDDSEREVTIPNSRPQSGINMP